MIKFYNIEDFYYIEDGRYVYDRGAPPFDEKQYLIKTNIGIVEAYWFEGGWSSDNLEGHREYDGWYWVCYDDAFQVEFDEVKEFAFIEETPVEFDEYVQTTLYDKDMLLSSKKIVGPEDFYSDVDFTVKTNIKQEDDDI